MEVTSLTSPEQSIPFPGGSLRVLGARRWVTGSMSIFDFDGFRVLVDCGMTQGRDDAGPFPEDAVSVDAVLLTHGHLDHVGALPELWTRGAKVRIYATPATLSLATIVLEDSLRLAGAKEDERRAFMKWFRKASVGVRYDLWRELGELRFAFREAGHILGSASIEMRTSKARVIASGDLGRQGIPILRDPFTAWDPSPAVDLVMMESTYGNRTHAPAVQMQDELERIIHHALQDGGHILVPAFAIGRTQTLLYHLNTLIEAGRVRNLPVALDTPMGIRVTEVYESSRHLYDEEALALLAQGDDPLDFDQLFAVRKGGQSHDIRHLKESMLIIAGSGMCSGGRIIGHLQELLPKPETDVLFVGYQGVGTPGRAILEAAAGRAEDGRVRTVGLFGKRVPVKAAVHQLSGLSAHADQNELASWFSAIPSVGRVVLNHGEPEAQEALGARLAARG
jgi:metallo-beta-lactamase family protein